MNKQKYLERIQAERDGKVDLAYSSHPQKQHVLIEANNLRKIYGSGSTEFEALKNISIQIKQGDSVAITGKSGSGKSTLMHTLALLDKPTEGELKIAGKNIERLNSKELNQIRNTTFGFVFQQFFMNLQDSVLENIMLPLKIAGVPMKERRQRGLEALKAVGLEDKANNKANNLSGGQKQRVCIARALINEPSIIFADEPTGNLDSETGKIVEKLLFDLNKDKGITLIMVTHDDALAKQCHRQIQIKDGVIIKEI